MRRLIFGAALALAWAVSPAQAEIIGLPADTGTGNCFPFGCAYMGEYQQVYASSAFSGAIAITSLEFYNTISDNGATAMNSGTWNISLSTSPANWNSLSSTFASNIGTGNTLVFSGNLSQAWAFGDTLVVNLTTPFTYDPSKGNLLMDVSVSGTTNAGGTIYFDTNGYNGGGFNGDTILGRVYNDGVVNYGYGLVTGFNETGISVPEPLTLSLFGAGLAGAAAMRRRKKTSA